MKKLMLSIFIIITFYFFVQNNLKYNSRFHFNPVRIEMKEFSDSNYFTAIKVYEFFCEKRKR